jgi:hypothetical protein
MTYDSYEYDIYAWHMATHVWHTFNDIRRCHEGQGSRHRQNVIIIATQIFLFQSCSQDCLEIARRSEFVPLLSSEHHPRLHARSKENGIHQDAAISARKKSL